MSKVIFSRKYRPLWASAMVVAVLVVVLAVPPVRAMAGKFLRLFRAEQVRSVYVDTTGLNEQMKKLRSSAELQKLLSSDFKVEPKGEPVEAESVLQAGERAGIVIRMPGALGDPSRMTVQPAAEVTIAMDLQKVAAILGEIGREDVQLPPDMDGAVVNVALPPSVVATFGSCGALKEGEAGENPDGASWRNPDCYVFSQLMSPTVTAPAGLKVNEVASALLQVLGMTADEAEAFTRTVDWSTTLVVPVPRNVSSAETLDVDGVKGTLVLQNTRLGSRFLLVWIKSEIVYTLSGWGDKEKALSIAGSVS